MSPGTGQCVGIDISEDFVDVYPHPGGKEVRLPHSDEGTAALLALLRDHEVERIVLESTGGLQREREVPGQGVHPGRSAAGACEAVHVGVQREEIQSSDRRFLLPSGGAGEDLQAGDDGVHAEAAGVDEHAGGPG
jgi:hypothetical protein